MISFIILQLFSLHTKIQNNIIVYLRCRKFKINIKDVWITAEPDNCYCEIEL